MDEEDEGDVYPALKLLLRSLGKSRHCRDKRYYQTDAHYAGDDIPHRADVY